MKILMLGNGGAAREIRSWYEPWEGEQIIGFLSSFHDDEGRTPIDTYVRKPDEFVIASLGDPATRKRICEELDGRGAMCIGAFSSRAIVSYGDIGDGCIVSPGSYVGPDCKIGRLNYFNFNTVVGHDCKIGSYCTLAPGAQILGGATLGDSVFVGPGAIVLPGAVVDDGAWLGAHCTILPGHIVGAGQKVMPGCIGGRVR